MNRDRIYSLPLQQVGAFAFDDRVAEVFPDMISRSVPGYASILSLIEQLATKYVASNSNVYDLGCSLGAASFLIQNHAPTSARIVAVDSSSAMIDRLSEEIVRRGSHAGNQVARCPIEPRRQDVREVAIEDASFVVLNFTLQFIPEDSRESLLQCIFDGMRPGGALVLSEKICFKDESEDQLLSDLHHDFKRAHGYSDLEISQKRTSLERTLIPESLESHVARLRRVGFPQVVPWFQCFNFVSILAVKAES